MSIREQINHIVILLEKQNELLNSFLTLFVTSTQGKTEIPFHDEGTCPQCSHAKVVSDGNLRQCKQCKFMWQLRIK